MSTTSKATIDAVRAALSTQRMRTYEYEVEIKSQKTADDSAAIKLYAWNAAVSGVLMAPPLHLCEVVVRNAVSDAIEAVYGPRWPWSPTFERSLPDPKLGYSQRYDLQSSRRSEPTTGKVIPELKFVFWQKMFTNRYDSRIWNHHLRRVMPNLDKTKNITVLRQSIYGYLERLRLLRNRIAHHEPIFRRALADDYQIIQALVMYRCRVTAKWLDINQNVTNLIAAKP